MGAHLLIVWIYIIAIIQKFFDLTTDHCCNKIIEYPVYKFIFYSTIHSSLLDRSKPVPEVGGASNWETHTLVPPPLAALLFSL